MASSRNSAVAPTGRGARAPVGCLRGRRDGGLRSLGRALLLAAVLLGCGARAAADGGADAEDEFGTDENPGSAGRGGGRGGAGGTETAPASPVDPGRPIGPDNMTLPDCEPGFRESSAGSRECTFRFRNECFEDERMACACACEGLGNSRCIINGFLDPDEPQSVSCSRL